MFNSMLICLDDLEHSKQIASYTAYVVGGREDTRITLFHCIPADGLDIGTDELELTDMDKPRIDRILAEYYEDRNEEAFSCEDVYNSAKQILKQAGINENNILEKLVVKKMDPSACILQEAYSNNHGTIVLGKRREVKLPITKLGNVTENVLTNAVGKTIWLVSIATHGSFLSALYGQKA